MTRRPAPIELDKNQLGEIEVLFECISKFSILNATRRDPVSSEMKAFSTKRNDRKGYCPKSGGLFQNSTYGEMIISHFFPFPFGESSSVFSLRETNLRR